MAPNTEPFAPGLANAHFRNYISVSVLKITTNFPVNKRPARTARRFLLHEVGLRNKPLGYGFRFPHINSRKFAIESLAHDSGRTLAGAKYGYPKGSPNTNS
jgi:hypothetical protein